VPEILSGEKVMHHIRYQPGGPMVMTSAKPFEEIFLKGDFRMTLFLTLGNHRGAKILSHCPLKI
jgi:hypothetical protein